MVSSLRRWLLPALVTILSLGLWSGALAQDLAELAPPSAILTVDVERPPNVAGALVSELADLGWESVKDTIERFIQLAGDDAIEAIDLEMLSMLSGPGPQDELLDELRQACPELPSSIDLFGMLEAGLATVAVSPMQPFPMVTAIARVRPDATDEAQRLQDALVGCFADATMRQDDIELHIFGDGSDLPVVVSRIDDVYVVGTTPDAVRAVIRRATGSGEPSLADRPLRQATERFQGTGVGLMVDVAAVADVIEAFAGPSRPGTSEQYFMTRLLDAARTLGGFATRWGLSAEGVVMESALAVNPDGGDPALADLLLCTTCGVSRAFLAPGGSVAVSSQHIPVRALFGYVQDVLDGAAEVAGERLDLRELAQQAFGFDLDAALLDWVGSEVHVVQLEAFEPAIGPLIYGVPTVAYMPVSSPEAARRGLAILGEVFGPLVELGFTGPGGPFLPQADLFDVPQGGAAPPWLATRTYAYRDIEVQRIQAGPTLDLAVALVGNHVVVANPSDAMEAVIDTFRGVRSALDSPSYRQARGDAPAGAPFVYVQDVGADLAGYAALGDALAQPVASLLALGTWVVPVSASSQPTDPVVSVGQPLVWSELPVTIEGALSTTNTNEFGEPADQYVLTGIPTGERVTISLSSDAFDTYLYLLDVQGNILDSNDDAGFDTDSGLTFTSSGADLVIEASSFGGSSTGPYTLTIERGDIADLPQIDLTGIEPTPLTAPGTIQDALGDTDVLPSGDIGRTYALQGLRAGERIEIEVTSDAFDTYLRVIQPAASVLIAENDDAPDTSRSAATVYAGDEPLWVQVTSWSGSSRGAFTLTVGVLEAPAATTESTTVEDAAEDATNVGAPDTEVEPPTFADLLELAEIVPRALDVLADRVGTAHGFGTIDGNVVYRRTVIEVDW